MVLRQILNPLLQVDSIKIVSEMAALTNVNLQMKYLFNQHFLGVFFCSDTTPGTVDTVENKVGKSVSCTYWGQIKSNNK